ncbi:MAG TPA: hypothetical protein VG984_01160 [Candidatus Paceibacterota bacterium]|nr:hypothetical protein [Candidatus Paceibacterota bacterium]
MEKKKPFLRKTLIGIGIFFIFVLLLQLGESQKSPVPSTPQVVAAPESSSSADKAPQENSAPPFVKKTETGTVRLSSIQLNQATNMNNQTIIFGGDADGWEDGTSWICVINIPSNFISVNTGDTITATGDNVSGTKALLNCHLDALEN